MFIDWTCVYDDGTRPWSDDIRRDQRRPLSIPVGEDVTIRMSIVNPSGAPVSLALDDAIAMTARAATADRKKLFTKSATRSAPTATSSRWTIALAGSDTKHLRSQVGTFDVVATISATGASATLVPSSALDLQPSPKVS